MAKSNGSRWRRAAAAVVVAVLALSMVTTGVLAQDDATPPAGDPPNPEEPAEEPAVAEASSTGATAAEKTRLAAAVQALTDAIALVQADRDAVASQIDPAEIDGLLAKATELRDAAQATIESADVSTAPQAILAGTQAAMAAQALLEAELSAYGLPSQQGRASHVLVGAYYAIDEASALAATETDANAGANADANAAFFLETAQRLYARAYEQYNAGAYAQAERTAQVAQQVAGIGALLQADAPGRPGVDRAEDAGVARPEVGMTPTVRMVPGAIDGFGSATFVLAPSALAERGLPGEESILDVPEPNFE